MESSEVLPDEYFTLPKNNFQKEGYEFIGWSLSQNGTDVVFKNKEQVFNLASKGQSITLYAVCSLW